MELSLTTGHDADGTPAVDAICKERAGEICLVSIVRYMRNNDAAPQVSKLMTLVSMVRLAAARLNNAVKINRRLNQVSQA